MLVCKLVMHWDLKPRQQGCPSPRPPEQSGQTSEPPPALPLLIVAANGPDKSGFQELWVIPEPVRLMRGKSLLCRWQRGQPWNHQEPTVCRKPCTFSRSEGIQGRLPHAHCYWRQGWTCRGSGSLRSEASASTWSWWGSGFCDHVFTSLKTRWGRNLPH